MEAHCQQQSEIGLAQRFEIAGFLAFSAFILWFDPRREHSSIPTIKSRSRRAQALSRLAASSWPPAGLGLDWPEHDGILNQSGMAVPIQTTGFG